jgi:hypothetical protein
VAPGEGEARRQRDRETLAGSVGSISMARHEEHEET